MLSNFEAPKEWEAECEFKEIFKSGVYRNRSNIPMDALEKSIESEYSLQ